MSRRNRLQALINAPNVNVPNPNSNPYHQSQPINNNINNNPNVNNNPQPQPPKPQYIYLTESDEDEEEEKMQLRPSKKGHRHFCKFCGMSYQCKVRPCNKSDLKTCDIYCSRNYRFVYGIIHLMTQCFTKKKKK